MKTTLFVLLLFVSADLSAGKHSLKWLMRCCMGGNAVADSDMFCPLVEAINQALVNQQYAYAIHLVRTHKPDLNNFDTWGCLPIVIAAEQGHLIMFRFLLEAGADPQKKDGRKISAWDTVKERKDREMKIRLNQHSRLLRTHRAFQKLCAQLKPYTEPAEDETFDESTTLVDDNQICAACLSSTNEEQYPLRPNNACLHPIHAFCAQRWIMSGGKNCPLCRTNFTLSPAERLVVKASQELKVGQEQRSILLQQEMGAWNPTTGISFQVAQTLPGAEFLPDSWTDATNTEQGSM